MYKGSVTCEYALTTWKGNCYCKVQQMFSWVREFLKEEQDLLHHQLLVLLQNVGKQDIELCYSPNCSALIMPSLGLHDLS